MPTDLTIHDIKRWTSPTHPPRPAAPRTPLQDARANEARAAEAIGVTFDRRVVMFEAVAEAGGYPDYTEIAERARQWGESRIGHSSSRHTVKPDA